MKLPNGYNAIGHRLCFSACTGISSMLMLLMSLFLPTNALGVPDLLTSGPHLGASNSEVLKAAMPCRYPNTKMQSGEIYQTLNQL